jgi:hypothetical protein
MILNAFLLSVVQHDGINCDTQLNCILVYTVMLNFDMLSVVILNAVVLNVIGKTLLFVFALLQDIDK